MRDILQEIRNGNDRLQQSLRKISNTFYNNSELSIQEAVYNILQLPLSRSSEECIFIPTFPPTDRVHLVKSQTELQMLEKSSTDIYEHGLIEHYINRPEFLENVTLADFAANYRYATKPGPNSISLLNKSGYIFHRKQPRVIRFRNYHFEIGPENFLREHVMLCIPWRNEKADIL
ncbi:Formamidopyrimidine-DNA glycosylase [Frankliniella fusca]|uniref:Formamidopyrimidine-DNA glycosylase n=1 Tax=Frankliniella fusca TaxID=407009 RepID=A0AAE1LEI6_9NEOP|nr:Formamidopyrimidine-DNA glycosylase [Frankliniella fusca]